MSENSIVWMGDFTFMDEATYNKMASALDHYALLYSTAWRRAQVDPAPKRSGNTRNTRWSHHHRMTHGKHAGRARG